MRLKLLTTVGVVATMMSGSATALLPKLVQFPVSEFDRADAVDFGPAAGDFKRWLGVVPIKGDTYEIQAWCERELLVFRFPTPHQARALGEERLQRYEGTWLLDFPPNSPMAVPDGHG